MTVRTQYLDQNQLTADVNDDEIPRSKRDLMAMGKDVFALVAALKTTDLSDILKKMTAITPKKLLIAAALVAFVFIGRD